eukprot:8836780-Pyramimonas_sp.AAC.1
MLARSLPRTREASRAFGRVDVPRSIAAPCTCNRGCEGACQAGLFPVPPRGGSVFCPRTVSAPRADIQSRDGDGVTVAV